MNINGRVWVLVLVMLMGCAQEPQPSVSPVGSWQGTLTSGDDLTEQTFMAQITEAVVEGVYSGAFTVSEKVFVVTGYYRGSSSVGDNFFFNDPSEDLRPALSEPVYVDTSWSGVMSETTYEGRWEFNSLSDGSAYSSGEFSLERQP